MTVTPSVTCVVVAFHRPEPLARLLAKLRHPAVEVVVVNVDDDRDVASVAGDLARPLPGNPGYASAVNAGARLANAPVIVFMNDDIEIEAEAVLSLAGTVSADEADVVLPSVLDGDGKWQPTIAALPRPRTLLREWLLLPDRPPPFLVGRDTGVQKWRSPTVPEPVDAAAATVVAVSADLLRTTPLPEEYFLYWEESDWFWRLKGAGARVVYDPGVTVRHAGGRDEVRPAKSRLMARNAVRCVRRTQGRAAALLAWPIVILWNLRLVAVDGLRCIAGSREAAARFPARAAGLAAAVLAWREL